MVLYRKKYTKLSCILLIIILSYYLIHLYSLVCYNKRERMKIIKKFDEYNNETDYGYLNTNFIITNYKRALSDIEKIRQDINKINSDAEIFNSIFLSVNSIIIVIVVQTHDRIEYLTEVIDSLRTVRGIMRALVIFSHDYYNEDINELIRQIDFTSFMQIFYPYSEQLHPNSYPGQDSKYCSKNWKCTPTRGQRNSTLAQVKLHWWWKCNHIFNHIEILENYNGLVMFLEDDQYVTEDFIYTAMLLEGIKAYECPECYMISVGAVRPQLFSYHSTRNVMTIEEFGTTPYSMGIAFNRTVWNIFRTYDKQFCYFNDYNWISSLRYLGKKTTNKKILMFTIAGPRIFHIGRCGLNNPGDDCNVSRTIDYLQKFFKLIKKGLYPKNYEMRQSSHKRRKIIARGKFNDIRDQELCAYFGTNNKIGI